MKYNKLKYKESLRIIERCNNAIMGINDCYYPYVIPVNYDTDYIDGKIVLYFNFIKMGKKMELLRGNSFISLLIVENCVGFTNSVLINGEACLLDDDDYKCEGIKVIVNGITGRKYLK